MSAECMAWAKRQKLILGKKSVLFMLANYCDDKNSCYPSYQTLADDCGFKDPKSVQRIVKQLEEEGYLRRESRFLPKISFCLFAQAIHSMLIQFPPKRTSIN